MISSESNARGPEQLLDHLFFSQISSWFSGKIHLPRYLKMIWEKKDDQAIAMGLWRLILKLFRISRKTYYSCKRNFVRLQSLLRGQIVRRNDKRLQNHYLALEWQDILSFTVKQQELNKPGNKKKTFLRVLSTFKSLVHVYNISSRKTGIWTYLCCTSSRLLYNIDMFYPGYSNK